MTVDTGQDPELRQRLALRRNRIAATSLLLLMAGVFVSTSLLETRNFWLDLLHATAEAGVIGGLADWFAITALFRRPLGLPIPHTAILPRSKNRIGEGLGIFLERHFLTETLVVARLRASDLAGHAANWLGKRSNADILADRVVAVLPHLAAALDDEELRSFTAKALGLRLRDVDAASVTGKVLGLMTASGHHVGALDWATRLARDFLDRHADEFVDAASEGPRRRWWIPAAVNKQVARAGLTGLRQMLDELQVQNSALRTKALATLDAVVREVATAPAYREKIEAAKLEFLEQPDVQRWLRSVWDEIRDLLLADLASPQSATREAIATALVSVATALQADAAMRARLNKLVEEGVVGLLPWRGELARFIADVVRRWDEKALVQRVELALGADLQYVRMTGTLVGASIGCLLALVPHVVALLR